MYKKILKPPYWILILYLGFIFFNSFTKLSVPAMGRYELTISDLLILFVSAVFILFKSRIKKAFAIYLYVYTFFLFSVGISIVKVIDYNLYLSEIIPYIFGFFIVFSSVIVFSSFDNMKLLKRVRIILVLVLALSTLPVYYQMVTGIKLEYFFDSFGWRYTFLAQNPNQYGVSLLLYSIIISLITLKFDKKNISKLLIFMLFFIPAALFSGSKTTTLIFGLNFIFIAILTFVKSKIAVKMTVVPLVVIILISGLPLALEFLRTNGGQISRAISIFEAIGEQGVDGIMVKEDSGQTMNEAIILFYNNPLLGVGLANKPMHSPIVTEIHNTYLKTLAEAGSVGFIGFAAIFFLPLIAFLFSRASLVNKLFFIVFYILWAAMNWPAMLLRQRWVWLFMVILFLIARIGEDGKIERSKLSLLN
jgi:O-antigen ligase